MLKWFSQPRAAVTGAVLVLAMVSACTKKAGTSNAPAPSTAQTPGQPNNGTTPSAPNSGGVEAVLTRFALQSLAGDVIFCQTFSTASKLQLSDVESTINALAGAQAGIPAGMLNPFTVQSLALSVKNQACARVPELLNAGHCALTVQKQTATGLVSFATEQRLFWKDIPTLAQAANVKTSLDGKTALLSSKNAILLSLNRQLTQQRQLLQFLQATTGQSGLIADAQALLTSLQEQVNTLDGDIKRIEDEIKPIEDEMNKRIAELNTARAALKLACNPASMGATAAAWKDQ
ncbi:MAG: hypothetical protein FJY29_11050 [Betaproteobacteria bacterium]|nr:hypothetical protein [Betaproteobacteria bacterium]